MAKPVKVTVCGVTGTGRTKTEARQQAEEAITARLAEVEGDYDPRLLSWRSNLVLIYRRPLDGWVYVHLTSPEDGLRTGRLMGGCYSSDTLAQIEASVRLHLAEQGWTPEEGPEPPDILTQEDERQEFRLWARWQLAYRAARERGLADEEAREEAWRARREASPVERVPGFGERTKVFPS